MRTDDVKLHAASGVHFITIIEDEPAGRSVKTDSSVRAVPIHPELIRIGLVEGSVPVAHEPVIPLIAYRFPKAFAKHSKTCSSEKLSLEVSSTPKSRSCCFFEPSV